MNEFKDEMIDKMEEPIGENSRMLEQKIRKALNNGQNEFQFVVEEQPGVC